MSVEYVIEIRNRRQPGDHWMRWGASDTEAEAATATTALRAAIWQLTDAGRAVLDTHGGAP